MGMDEGLNVIIVEDDAVIAQLIESDLTDSGHHVVAIAHSAHKTLEVLEKYNADLVLLDIDLASDMDGIDIAKNINKKYNIPFLFLTAFSDRKTLHRAMETKPCGYLVKPYKLNDLKAAITIGLYNFASRKSNKGLTLENINKQCSDVVSSREFDIIKDIVDGLTNAQIAENQYLSLNTIKWHLQNIYSKFGVKNRTSLVKIVLRVT